MYDNIPDLLQHIAERSQALLGRFDEKTVLGTSPQDLNPKLWSRFRTPISPKDDQGPTNCSQTWYEGLFAIDDCRGEFIRPESNGSNEFDPTNPSTAINRTPTY